MALTRRQTAFELLDQTQDWQPAMPVNYIAGLEGFETVTFYIYGLRDPRTDCICYVGKTNGLLRRLLQHMACDGSNAARVAWLAELKAQDMEPEIVVLEECDMETWPGAEIAWIAKGRALGWPLLNITEGGEAGGKIGFQKVYHEQQ